MNRLHAKNKSNLFADIKRDPNGFSNGAAHVLNNTLERLAAKEAAQNQWWETREANNLNRNDDIIIDINPDGARRLNIEVEPQLKGEDTRETISSQQPSIKELGISKDELKEVITELKDVCQTFQTVLEKFKKY
jgi:bifunctional DNA-binding transcriptional regulator/antitoxin component of YhaV-PrlF toxin-antitoxin module